MSDDVQDLRAQTERTREELAQTVEALAQKADVKGRTKEKLVGYKDHARETVAHDADLVKQKASAATGVAREKATAATGVAKEKAFVAKDAAKGKAFVAKDRTVETHRSKPWALPAAGGGLIAAVLAFVLVRRRK